MTHIDHETWLRVSKILSHSLLDGLDPGEELYRHGLILTPAKELELRVGGMEFLLEELTRWRPVELLRMKFTADHPASPADMYRCIVQFIDDHINGAKRKGS